MMKIFKKYKMQNMFRIWYPSLTKLMKAGWWVSE